MHERFSVSIEPTLTCGFVAQFHNQPIPDDSDLKGRGKSHAKPRALTVSLTSGHLAFGLHIEFAAHELCAYRALAAA